MSNNNNAPSSESIINRRTAKLSGKDEIYSRHTQHRQKLEVDGHLQREERVKMDQAKDAIDTLEPTAKRSVPVPSS